MYRRILRALMLSAIVPWGSAYRIASLHLHVAAHATPPMRVVQSVPDDSLAHHSGYIIASS